MDQTLGPDGPPLQRGVFEVPQSTQVLIWFPSVEPLSVDVLLLLFISSDSDP